MRCLFAKGKQKELLLYARSSLNLPWRELARKLNVGYTTLRDWRDEKWSMRQNVFENLVELCPECKSFEIFVVKLKEDNWGQKLGGFSTKQRKHGFLDPKYDKQSRTWKSHGGQIGTRKWHAKMKSEAPLEYRKIQYDRIKQSLKYKHEYQGQKYRNFLELDVAKTLTDTGVHFEYERLLEYNGKFFFPDFVIGKLILECTFWHDARQKAKELQQKADCYLKLNFDLVVIITTKRYVEYYTQSLLHPNVRVITCEHLSEFLDGKFGRVKRAT